MYVRPQVRQGPRTADIVTWPAPTGGLVASRNLATPEGTPAAKMLENFFPTATGITIRRGSQLYATVGGGTPDVEEMWTYIAGNSEKFYAATTTTIYDITVPLSPVAVVSGLTSGDWVVTQFATTGGTFLVAVNGHDPMLIFDGSFWYPVHASNSYTIAYDGGTGAFTVGQVVTGLTSGSKGTITAKTGTVAVGTLTLSNVTGGNFQDNETLDDPLTGVALANGTRKLHSNLHTLPYDAGTLIFHVGQVVTGTTSGAKGTIRNISGTVAVGTLVIDSLVGTFVDNEPITDPLGGAALVNGTTTLRLSGITGLPVGVDTSVWSYVWVYQNRLFFVEKESLNAWYLAVDSIGGPATVFPLGGVFTLGGSLLFGSSWNIESSDGLDSRCIFVTGNESNSIGNMGEIAVYSGIDPSDPNQWGLVGVYRSGMPMGKKAHIRAGGDIVIATDLGFVPLSVAISRDIAALAPSSLSFAIEDEWADNVERRSSVEWKCMTWPTGRMTVVMLPTLGYRAKWLVGNVRTGAWCTFTDLDAKCLAVYQDRFFFGSAGGKVVEAMVTGMDQGAAYTATVVPLFQSLQSAAAKKIPNLARAVLRSPVPVNPTIRMQYEFKIALQPAPAATPVPSGTLWGTGVLWGEVENGGSGAVWGGADVNPNTYKEWVSVDGLGDDVAPALRLTSGSIQPLDAELVRIEAMCVVAEVVT